MLGADHYLLLRVLDGELAGGILESTAGCSLGELPLDEGRCIVQQKGFVHVVVSFNELMVVIILVDQAS